MRDCDGHIVWRVKVAPGEKTCLTCGETTAGRYCPRCSLDDEGQPLPRDQRTALVDTISYLYEGEWEPLQ